MVNFCSTLQNQTHEKHPHFLSYPKVKVKLFPCTLRQYVGEWTQNFTHSQTGHYTETSCQFHGPADLPPGEKVSDTHSTEGWVGPRTSLDASDQKNRFPLPRIGTTLPPLSSSLTSSTYQLCYPDSHLCFNQWRTEVGGGGGVKPPLRNSEGSPKSSQTEPNCEKCYKLLNLDASTPRCSEKKAVKF